MKALHSFCISAAFLVLPPLAGGGEDPAALLQRCVELSQSSRLFEAAEILKAVPEGSERFVEAQTMLGQILLRCALPRQAEEAFRRVLKDKPSRASAHLGLGVALSQQAQLEGAGREYEQALSDSELGEAARAQYIQNLFWLGKEEEAFREAQRQVLVHSENPDFHTILGFLFSVRGRKEEALTAYQRALELAPGRLAHYLSLISLHRERREWDMALSLANRALELDRNHPLIYGEMAGILDQMGKPAEAESARHEEARTLNAELLYARALKERRSGRRREAEELLRRAVESNPRHGNAWSDLGEMERRAGRIENAKDSFRRALELDPVNPVARNGLAAALDDQAPQSGDVKLGYARDEPGQRVVSQANGIVSSRETAGKRSLDGLAYARMKEGKNAEAAGLFERSLRTFGGDAWIHHNLGFLYQREGKFSQAAEQYRRARRFTPQDAVICHNLGFALYLAKDYTAAVEPLEKALQLRPGWGLAHFNLAMAYWNLRLHGQALQHARAAQSAGIAGAVRISEMLSGRTSATGPRLISGFRPRR